MAILSSLNTILKKTFSQLTEQFSETTSAIESFNSVFRTTIENPGESTTAIYTIAPGREDDPAIGRLLSSATEELTTKITTEVSELFQGGDASTGFNHQVILASNPAGLDSTLADFNISDFLKTSELSPSNVISTDSLINLDLGRLFGSRLFEFVDNELTSLDKILQSLVGQLPSSFRDVLTGENVLNLQAFPSYNITRKSTDVFEPVHTEEELELELRKITRPVTEVVFWWTKTALNENILTEDINETQKNAGYSGIQHHYVIQKNGNLVRGLPVEQLSDSRILNPSNRTSTENTINVIVVGGYNCFKENPQKDKYLSSSSINRNQFNTIDTFIDNFFKTFPSGQVTESCSFVRGASGIQLDMSDYVFSRFNKRSIYRTDEDFENGPYSPRDLQRFNV